MTARDDFAAIKTSLRTLNQAAPEPLKAWNAYQKAAKEAGPLTPHQKELAALAIAIATRCEPCIHFHIEAFRRAGGTREELADLGLVAVTMGGGPALMYAAKAMTAWDELAA